MPIAVDRAAWAHKIEDLHGQSYGWALTVCRYDRQEAEDVLHTAYLKVLDGRARFEGRASFKTWLFAVIRNTAADRRRRLAVVTLGLARLFSLEPADPAGAGPEDSASGGEDRARIRAALAALSPMQREVLDLVFYHDLTLEEAAGVMGVTIGTARVHYDRGKKRLRERL